MNRTVTCQLVLLVGLSLLLPVDRAFCQEDVIVDRMDAELMAELLQEWGYRAKTDTLDSGRWTISSAAAGTNFVVLFYDCLDDDDVSSCEDIQFQAWFGASYEGTMLDANIWNGKKRHANAYYDDRDGTVGLFMDLTLKGGVTKEYLEQYMNLWQAYLAQFTTYLAEAH